MNTELETKAGAERGETFPGKSGKAPVSTPYFLIDEERLRKNLEILKKVQEDTGCRILLAQKAFSTFFAYPLIREYLAGSTASGLYEARLGREEFGPMYFHRPTGRTSLRSC